MDTSETYIKMCNHPLVQKELEQHRDEDSVFGYKKMTREHIKTIWLPRQDQIQRMFDTEGYLALLRELGYWMDDEDIWEIASGEEIPTGDKDGSVYITGGYDSFEQLWLAFYMDEKHGLRWSNGKWEEIE